MKHIKSLAKAILNFLKDNILTSDIIFHVKFFELRSAPFFSRTLLTFLFIFPFGINAHAQSYEIDDNNGKLISTCSGDFYDSNFFDGFYNDNENYTVTFCSTNGNTLRFSFSSFWLENLDTLFLYDGPNTSSPLIKKYTGNLAPFTINSSGTCFTFVFKSNSTFTRPGWAASITCCPPPVTSPIVPSINKLCAGTTVNYSVENHVGSTYNWTVANGTPASITGGVNNLNVTWDLNGNVTGYVKVVEVNSCGSKDSSDLVVDIDRLPTVNFSGLNAYYCIYSAPATLTGFPAGGSFTGPGISGNTFNPATAGAGTHSITYFYTDPVTGCSNQRIILTTVDVPSVFSVGASALAYCTGSGVTITLSGSVPGVNYQLLVDGVNDGAAIPGSSSPLSWANKTHGVYTVIATGAASLCNNNMSGSQTITENPLPVPSFSTQAGSATCSINSVSYVTQAGQTNYVWGFTGVAGTDYVISSGGTSTDNSVTLMWLTAGNKFATINYTNSNSCTATAPVSSTATLVTINPAAPSGSAVQNFCTEASPVVGNLNATGSGIQWYNASSGGSLYLPSTPLTDGTHYFASQTVNGCEGLTRLDVTASITSIPLPPAAIAGTGSACSQITANWTASTRAVSYRLDVSSVNTFSSFVSGYQDLNVGNVTTYTITGLAGGTTYYYRIRAVNNCGASVNSNDISYSTLPAMPVVPGPVSGTTPQCPGLTGQLYSIGAVPDATVYTWSVPAGWTIISGQGTTSITVSTGAAGQNGNIGVTAGNSCGTSAPGILPVTVNPGSAITSVTGVSPLCIGGTSVYSANGVVLSGGTGVWSSSDPAVATVSAVGLVTGISAGTCNIIYTITGGCGGTVSAQQSVTINTGAAITSVTGLTPLCIGGTTVYSVNGAVNGGGTGSWSSSNPSVATVNSAGLVTGISSGTCNIIYTITGGCGGTVSAQQSVTIRPDASITSVTGLSPLCIGGTSVYNASGVVLSGGTGAWSSSNSAIATVDASGLVRGVSVGNCNIIYTITGGCGGVVSSQQSLTVSPDASVASVTGSGLMCIGASTVYSANGVVLSGGTGIWSSSNTAVATVDAAGSVTGLSTGTSNIIYTISGGCGGSASAFRTITITNPPAATISYTGSPWCSNTGTRNVTIVGTAGGTFSASPSGLSIDPVTGTIDPGASSGGTYTVTYSISAVGCGIVTATTSVTVYTAPTVIVHDPAAVCSPGTVNLTLPAVTSGSTPGLLFTYWNDAAATSSLGTPTAVTAGVYYIKGTDGLSCSDIEPVRVTVNPLPAITGTKTDVVCNGAKTGSIDITVSGGSGPYSYLWTGTGVVIAAEDQTGLGAGSYSVVVTDANICSSSVFQATITEPAALSGSILSQTNVSVFGGNDGSVTVAGSGGTPPYLYRIGSGTYQASGIFGSLSAGSYVVTVQDFNLCTFGVTVNITQPLPPLTGSITAHTDVPCYGTATGSLTVQGSGGLAPYDYSINGGLFQVSGTFGNLVSGDYTVTVRDATLNTTNLTITLTQPSSALGGSITSQTDILCFGSSTGSITVAGNGGVPPYQYKISSGSYQTSGSFSSLAAGVHTITVRDANLCTFDITATLVQPPTKVAGNILSQKNVTCSGLANGEVTIAGTGGILPYQYSFNGATFQNSGKFSGLAAGTYSVAVRDANLCSVNVPVTISQPAVLSIAYEKTDASCPDVNDGSITLIITGGTQPYTVIWSDGETKATRSGIPDGTYSVVVTDINGCAASTVITVGVVGSEKCLEVQGIITPNGDGYNDTWKIRNIELFPNAEVFVFTRWGKLVFSTRNLPANPWDGTSNGKLLPTDSYHYTLHLNDGSKPRSGVVSIIR